MGSAVYFSRRVLTENLKWTQNNQTIKRDEENLLVLFRDVSDEI